MDDYNLHIQIKILVAGAIAFKAVGSILFIFGSTIGATLLVSNYFQKKKNQIFCFFLKKIQLGNL